MKQLTWDEYYNKFYDWSESTQARNLSALTSLGPADQVGEIIIELQVDVRAANRLLRKAVEAKLAFSAADLIEFLCINDKELATAAVYNSAQRLSEQNMEELYGEVDDAVIREICIARKLRLPEFLHEEDEALEESEEEFEEEFLDEDLEDLSEECEEESCSIEEGNEMRARKPGFFSTLFAVALGSSLFGGSDQRQHNGRCNGDCANCPPHYGYRYGRWYYGHDHVYGCEFGGNRGSGSSG